MIGVFVQRIIFEERAILDRVVYFIDADDDYFTDQLKPWVMLLIFQKIFF